MIRFFLDSSVLFSATFSAKGHSRDLLLLAAREEITLVVSQIVIEETTQNLADFAPETLPYLDELIEAVPFEYVRPTKKEVLLASKHVTIKDAPILAAAKKGKVDALVTLDRKHLLGKPAIVNFVRTRVITPKEAIDFVKGFLS